MAPTPDAFAPWTRTRLAALNAQFEPKSPEVVLSWAAETFGADLVQGTGFGASGVVIMHLLSQVAPETTVFYLDTDLLFEETYALRDELDERIGLPIERVHGGLSLDEQAKQEQPQLWRHNPDQCCFLRKVRPLQRYLDDKRAWITGLRRDQSKLRANTPILEWKSNCQVLKINPLASWSRKDVWRHIVENDLPYNELHDQGFPSVGCVPCTASVPGSDGYSRQGRWKGSAKSECGIHTS